MKRLPFMRVSLSLGALAIFYTADCGLVRADNETVSVADEQSAAEILDRIMQAQTTAGRLKTVHATGTYEVFLKSDGDRKETLVAHADIEFFRDNGKFSIDLRVTRDDREKVLRYPRIVAVSDGMDIFIARFSPRINPTGCAGDIYSDPTPALQVHGFDLRNVNAPWRRMVEIDKLIENLGYDAITAKRLPGQVVRLAYKIKNSPSGADFDVSPKVGFNVTGKRSFRPDDPRPVHAFDAKWRLDDGVWHVETFTEVWDRTYRQEPLERSVVAFQKFETNPKIKADQFDLSSVGIPARTRFIDRRKNPASRFRYFDGRSLPPW